MRVAVADRLVSGAFAARRQWLGVCLQRGLFLAEDVSGQVDRVGVVRLFLPVLQA